MKTPTSLLAPALACLVLGLFSVACGGSARHDAAHDTPPASEGSATDGAAADSSADAGTAAATDHHLPPIVAKSIEHHGGEVFHHSRSTMEVCSASGCFSIQSMIDGGVFEHVVETTDRDSIRKVRWTNDTVEEWIDGEKQELDEEATRRARDFASARIYFPHLPFRLDSESIVFEDQGLETWDGEELHRMKVTFAPGTSSASDDAYVYWFAPETGELKQFGYSFGPADDTGLRFRRLINQRRLGGVLFADQTNLGASGPGLGVDDLTPSFVAEKMEEVSIVRFKNITMQRLEG